MLVALKAMRNELLKRVSNEEDRTLPKVKEWIAMAEEIESKATSLLDESISERYNLSPSMMTFPRSNYLLK